MSTLVITDEMKRREAEAWKRRVAAASVRPPLINEPRPRIDDDRYFADLSGDEGDGVWPGLFMDEEHANKVIDVMLGDE